jgi:MFS superfamily sulfate permease-like transporter
MATNPFPAPLIILTALLLLSWLAIIIMAKRYPNKYDWDKVHQYAKPAIIILAFCTISIAYYAALDTTKTLRAAFIGG